MRDKILLQTIIIIERDHKNVYAYVVVFYMHIAEGFLESTIPYRDSIAISFAERDFLATVATH